MERKIKRFNAIAGGEGPRLYVLLTTCRVLQIHISQNRLILSFKSIFGIYQQLYKAQDRARMNMYNFKSNIMLIWKVLVIRSLICSHLLVCGGVGKSVYSLHILLKSLYQVAKVSGDLYVC